MKKFLVFLLVVALVFGIAGTANAILFNSHDYILVTYQGESWDEATNHMLANCGLNYHLATITSQEEQNFIESLIGGGIQYWLGGFQPPDQVGAKAEWQWVNGDGGFWDNGDIGLYTNWHEGEANDYFGVGSEQHLAIGGGVRGPHWNDEGSLNNISGYIAESAPAGSAPVPEPASMLLFGSGLIGMAVAGRRKVQRKLQ